MDWDGDLLAHGKGRTCDFWRIRPTLCQLFLTILLHRIVLI